MKLTVSVKLEHPVLGNVEYFQKMDLYPDTTGAGILYMIIRLSSFIGVKLTGAYDRAMRHGRFEQHYVNVDTLTNGKKDI